MVRLTVSLDEDLHEDLRELVRQKKASWKEYVATRKGKVRGQR